MKNPGHVCPLKQQAAQIQKVSDQVALTATAPRLTENNHEDEENGPSQRVKFKEFLNL